jgi:hypothetical protein
VEVRSGRIRRQRWRTGTIRAQVERPSRAPRATECALEFFCLHDSPSTTGTALRRPLPQRSRRGRDADPGTLPPNRVVLERWRRSAWAANASAESRGGRTLRRRRSHGRRTLPRNRGVVEGSEAEKAGRRTLVGDERFRGIARTTRSTVDPPPVAGPPRVNAAGAAPPVSGAPMPPVGHAAASRSDAADDCVAGRDAAFDPRGARLPPPVAGRARFPGLASHSVGGVSFGAADEVLRHGHLAQQPDCGPAEGGRRRGRPKTEPPCQLGRGPPRAADAREARTELARSKSSTATPCSARVKGVKGSLVDARPPTAACPRITPARSVEARGCCLRDRRRTPR